MEEKQLNLNQPLLSVRRFSSTLASETDHKSKSQNSLARLPLPPAYKSELNSVPERNAGNVPFVWEKAPGRPKDESKLQTQDFEKPPFTSNFPPGRVSKTKQQSLAEMRTGSTLSNSQSVASLDKKATKNSKGETREKESSGSDDGDEAYEDARDSLSRTESFFMSCSVSGLSGWDEQEVQPFGSFSSDHQQGRNFMIDRFLLAAKAMTSETPQYASKKAHIGQEQQKQKKKEVNTESPCPINQHRPKALPHYTQDIDGEESDDCSEYENYTTTTCGLFPRFCLLNPMPGLRMVDRVPRNAAHGMQAKSAASHIGSSKEQGRTPYGKKLRDSQSGFTEEKEILDILVKSKHGIDPYQRGCTQHDSSYESHVHEKTLYVDSVHKVKSQTNNIGGDFETSIRDSGIYNNSSIDSSPKVIKSKKINSESQVYGRDKNSDILTQNSELDLKRQLAAKWVDEECTLASSKVRYNGKIDLESQCLTKLGHQEISGASCFGLPLALPALKAPSESWLKRTLPTICKRNMTSQSNLTANTKTPKTTPLHPKWETNC
ncbi:hypothetical protein JHK86_034631 [Glycine max]|nr:hypothetical protein JHK86_034631 [Glycine max]